MKIFNIYYSGCCPIEAETEEKAKQIFDEMLYGELYEETSIDGIEEEEIE